MSGLDGKDRRSRAEDLAVRHKGRSAEVGRNTNTLEDGCSSNHTRGISKTEVVLAGLDRLDTSLCNRTLQ